MKRRYDRHKMTGTKLYYVWKNMINRCTRPSHSSFKNYGGRGIVVCEKWMSSFFNFYDDMSGDSYNEDLQIDRVDNEKGYFKENCRWVPQSTNLANKSNVGKYLRGVSFNLKNKKYVSQISIDRINYYLGSFLTEIEASRAYDVIYKEWYGIDAPKH